MNSISQWIIGDKAAEKIAFLANVFHKTRVDAFNKKYGTMLREYRPWMSSVDMTESFKDHLAPEDKCCLDQVVLEEFQNRLDSVEQFTLFKEDIKDPIRIYSEIERDFPNAKDEFSEALSLLRRSCPWIAYLYDEIVSEVVPIRRISHSRGAGSASNFHLIGTLFLSLRRDPFAKLKGAISYAHEIGHTSLMILQNGDPIAHESESLEIYSPIRRENRPLIKSFHAIVASSYMLNAVDGMIKILPRGSDDFIYLQSFKERLVPEMKLSIGQFETINLTTIGRLILTEARNSLS